MSLPAIKGWEYQPDKCSCDDQFLAWLQPFLDTPGFEGPIFHMGTGMHHKVGLECAAAGVDCFAITVSLEEMEEAARKESQVTYSGSYRVVFQDIYQLDLSRTPDVAIMTLFHLGEMVSDFGDINYDQMDALIRKVFYGGAVLFYEGSSAWDRTKFYVNHLLEEGILVDMVTYNQLLIFRRPS